MRDEIINELKKEIEACCKCKDILNTECNKPNVFVGKDYPKVMLIGHSPSVRVKEKAEVVLKMNQPNRALYKYIVEEVLTPLQINIEEVYCTNLMKCYTNNLPEEINKTDKKYIDNICNNCLKLLEKEIEIIKPELIISLSGRVFQIISKKYMGKNLELRDCFGKLHTLNINNENIPYIPVVHIPKYKKIKEYYFPEQTKRLKSQGAILP